jgi:hypothetical protein
MKVHDVIFPFMDSHKQCGECRIRVYQRPRLTIVIASELKRGPAITNAAEEIATRVVQFFGLDPKRLVWVEHHESHEWPIHPDITPSDDYDFVSFTWDGKHMSATQRNFGTRGQVEELVGEPIEGGGKNFQPNQAWNLS